jgi:tetratricopeptide (TPR) repeat protein
MTASLDSSNRLLAAARTQADTAGLADTLLRHADALVHAGRLAEADAAVVEAAGLHHTRGASLDEARCLRLGATLQRLQGKLEGAAARAEASLTMAQGHAAEVAAAHAELGEIALARGDTPAAIREFDAAIATGATAPPAWLRARAKALALAGRFEDAAADLEAAAQHSGTAGDTAGALRATIEAATAWQQARRFDRAERLVEQARPRASAAGDDEALAGFALLSATAALERGDMQAARAQAVAARDHALASRAAAPYIGAAVALSRLDERAGDRPGAYAALATGWATIGDLLGPELARTAFEPLLRGLRAQWGAAAFDAARHAYEAARRAAAEGGLR